MLSCILCAAMLLQAGAASPTPRPANQTPPTFAVGTAQVLVDFVVTGKDGAAVAGLSEKDFKVSEDGKERKIVSFLAFGGGSKVGPADAAEATSSEDPAPLTGTISVLFVDDARLTPAQVFQLRPALKNLINAMADRQAALVLIAPTSKVSVARPLIDGRGEFLAAVDRINGGRTEGVNKFPISDAEAFAAERGDTAMLDRLIARFVSLNSAPSDRMDPDLGVGPTRNRAAEVAREARRFRDEAYATMARSLVWLGRQPGRHSLLMVSGGYARDPEDDRQRELVTLSLRANAPIHFIDARGLIGGTLFQGVEYGPPIDAAAGESLFAVSDAAEASSTLSDSTGGLAIRNSNDLTRALSRLFDTMTTYYLIGYEPPEHSKPGFRSIKVEARVSGLHILARRGYFDETGAAR
ncbi:MAG: VWA domain-containing protein [Vicinamibacteria bacterium]|nr:VWA domain-containing protein [Vicinamibacteria bacterium]